MRPDYGILDRSRTLLIQPLLFKHVYLRSALIIVSFFKFLKIRKKLMPYSIQMNLPLNFRLKSNDVVVLHSGTKNYNCYLHVSDSSSMIIYCSF